MKFLEFMKIHLVQVLYDYDEHNMESGHKIVKFLMNKITWMFTVWVRRRNFTSSENTTL